MATTVDQKKRRLIDALVQARNNLVEAARNFPEQSSETPFVGVWSINDLLAHLIGWDQTNQQAITEILDGRYPSFLGLYDKDWKTYNQRLVAAYRQPSLIQMLTEVRASHRKLVAFLESLPAKDIVNGKARSERGRTITIANLLRAEAADEQEHAGQVTAYLQTAVQAPSD